jgi:predicted GNAT family acetyltransferase
MAVKDNPELHRFELEVEGHLAIAAYRKADDVVTFVHTEVPDAIAGRGVGSELARGALELVRARGERIVARCSFIAAYVRRHPEFSDLAASQEDS